MAHDIPLIHVSCFIPADANGASLCAVIACQGGINNLSQHAKQVANCTVCKAKHYTSAVWLLPLPHRTGVML